MSSVPPEPHILPSPQAYCPGVSVVIPIYNGEQDLPDLLRCLRAQTYPLDRVEYWLVDNRSGDRTPTLLQAAADQAAQDGFPLYYRSQAQIQSSYAARNVGIRAATHNILAFTDADCRPQPGWLAALVQPFSQPNIGPNIGIVAGEVQGLPGSSILEHYAMRRQTLSQTHTLNHPVCPYGQTANLALRRAALQQSGLFRPYLTTGGDADLCWRILQSGQWQIQLAEAAIVQHRHRVSLSELRAQWQRYGRANCYLHLLHGVPLTPPLTLGDYGRRSGRWLLKEVAIALPQILARQVSFATLLDTPLDLFCTQARAQGQRQASLPPMAQIIEWLESDGSQDDS
jgi:glycosyltransferase involved in cell wall biosynthesis